MSLIEVKNGARTLGNKRLFAGLDLVVGHEDVVLLQGGNGSGKSTFLRSLGGEPIDTGSVLLGGRPVASWSAWERELLAPLVDQEPVVDLDVPAVDNLVDCLSVGCRWWNWFTVSRRSIRKRLMTALAGLMDDFGLTDVMLRPTRELSHGQRRLLTVLRALRPLPDGHPRVLLLDEPLAGLRNEKADAVLSALEQRRAEGWSIIVAEHSPGIGRLPITKSILFPAIP